MKIVIDISSIEEKYIAMSDEELKNQTVLFKERLKNGETLDDILIEAFATVREAGKRVLNMRPYDVQLLGGIILYEGKITEMKTGEGKTLVATLPLYLHALTGKGAHLVTVNDYLATRDSQWMGKIYTFVGLSVGLLLNDMDFEDRKYAYACDITYGTNNEYGFDYLRDNMAVSADEIVQPHHNYAIVDEVDSILVDEARTPLIISGPSDKPTRRYYQLAAFVPSLVREKDFEIDEKARTVTLTERGIANVERGLNIPNW